MVGSTGAQLPLLAPLRGSIEEAERLSGASQGVAPFDATDLVNASGKVQFRPFRSGTPRW
jgi:hypothetical protein